MRDDRDISQGHWLDIYGFFTLIIDTVQFNRAKTAKQINFDKNNDKKPTGPVAIAHIVNYAEEV